MSKAAEVAAEAVSTGSSAEAAVPNKAAEPASGTDVKADGSSNPPVAVVSAENAATSAPAPDAARAEGAAAAGGADDGAPNNSATEAPEEDVGDLLPPVDESCEAAREAVKKLYSVWVHMKALKSSDAKDDQVIYDEQREMQLQLLLLRRCHRAMKKAVDSGKATEALKRKSADEEAVNMETRRHLGACLRAVACRNRNVPIPNLRKLLPNLDGYEAKEMDVDDPDDDLATPEQLQAEMNERKELSKKLEGLQKQKAKELEEFRAYGRQRVEQDALVRKWGPMLEEWKNVSTLRPEPEGSAAEDQNAGKVLKLPTALQLIYKKFGEHFLLYDDAPSVSLSIEGVSDVAEGPPPEKRAKVKASTDTPTVCVKVVLKTGVKKEFLLRFATPAESSVCVALVAPRVSSPSTLLECLWPEDTGNLQGVSSDATSGKPYYWAQVLGGLGEKVLSGVPALQGLHQVSAKEVIQRLTERLEEHGK